MEVSEKLKTCESIGILFEIQETSSRVCIYNVYVFQHFHASWEKVRIKRIKLLIRQKLAEFFHFIILIQNHKN